ncbi:glycosyltransferase [Shewanella sp. Isolate11]|uniref:glycosyltransferase n=1 Tax=Shewanella sp. Isolate11 TaxID=2908530 RepID=UPI001EFD56C6|nr:glycosyltransferase [Shewanella sp. Isolate11]
MRILILNTLYYPFKVGGAEVSVQLLAEGLVKLGYEVHVACLSPKSYEFVNKCVNIRGVNIHYLSLANLYWPFEQVNRNVFVKLAWHLLDNYNPFMFSKLNSLIKEIKPNVIHTNNLAGFSSGIIKFVKNRYAKIKLIHTARDYYFFDPATTMFRHGVIKSKSEFMVYFWRWIRCRQLKHLDLFVGVSNHICDYYRQELDKWNVKSSTVYNPIEFDIDLRFEQKGNKDEISFGFIGRKSLEKGYDDFVRLASELESKYSDVSFVVAGHGDNKFVDMINRRHGCPTIIDLGFTASKDFFSKIDILIVPTKWLEPFGRTLVEAQRYQIPFIGYGAGGSGEIYEIFSEQSLICNSFSEIKLACENIIEGALNFSFDDEHKLVLQRFAIEKHVNEMNRLISAL